MAAHLEAAGELVDAYRWHMRAADWLRPRDLPAARAEWDNARRIADKLPADDPDVLAMRIVPRTMLISTTLYIRDDLATDETYRELYELTTRTGDETSLAIGMAGRSFSIAVNDGRADTALPIATELRGMAHRIRCDSETRGIVLNSVAFTELAVGEFRSALTMAEEILDLPSDCPEAEIASALSLRGFIETCSGDAETGRKAMQAGCDLSRLLHPVRFAAVQLYSAILAALGVVDPASLLDDARSAWELAESFGDICGIILSRWAYGTILLRIPGSHDDGIAVLRSTRATVHEHRLGACALATVATDLAVESARAGHLDEAIDELRGVFDDTLSGFAILAVLSAAALVDLLIDRGSAADLAEARSVLERWRARGIEVAALNLWLPRAEALLAAAEGDNRGYHRFAADYLRSCEELNAVGRLDQARQMTSATTG